MNEFPLLPAQETLVRRLWYDAWYAAGVTAFTLAYSFRYEGTRNVPQSGPALIIANHQSFLDPWIVGLAVKRHVVYLARKTLFRNRWFGAFIRSFNAVPIDQDGVGKEGIRTILDQLNLGKPVIVFPEGSRTPDGNIHELRPGIHLIIKKTQAPIIPVGIAGAYEAYPIWRKYPLFSPLFLPASNRTIAVSVGKPLEARHYAEMPREHAMAELRHQLELVRGNAEKLRRK